MAEESLDGAEPRKGSQEALTSKTDWEAYFNCGSQLAVNVSKLILNQNTIQFPVNPGLQQQFINFTGWMIACQNHRPDRRIALHWCPLLQQHQHEWSKASPALLTYLEQSNGTLN